MLGVRMSCKTNKTRFWWQWYKCRGFKQLIYLM